MKRVLFTVLLLVQCMVPYAQETSDSTGTGEIGKYHRSSLYSVLVKHSSLPYAFEIDSAFMVMPMPDKFNDHNLPLRSFESAVVNVKQKGKAKDKENLADIGNFLKDNQIAKQMIARWFNRDPQTGCFDMSLVQERGFYDASQLDIAGAGSSARGISSLGDAGEELIGKTFVIVNDITFVDKGETSSTVAGGLALAGAFASAILGDNSYRDIGAAAALVANEFDGFTVNITSYLYRLDWTEEIAGNFYQFLWNDSSAPDPERKAAFESSDIFTLDYVGQTTTTAGNLSSKSFSQESKSEQMLLVCTRAVDKSIVGLQRRYDDFKVNVPVYKIDEENRTVEVQIGMKEGINEKSQFEVLLPVEGDGGKISYQRVGMIQPVKGKIWDNRFGALEEARANAAAGSSSSKSKSKDSDPAADLESASLTSTTFKILSGAGSIVPGCLVREKTIAK